MSQNGKLMPNLDQQSTKLLNLIVLQRIDPFVEEILITAAHVTFYELNVELSQWSRKDVEGSLFVVKRNAQPRFQFIVMNWRNTGFAKPWQFDTLLGSSVVFRSKLTMGYGRLIFVIFKQITWWRISLGDFEFEIQVPFLLYQNASQEVNGIWFYNSQECEEVASLFRRILSAYAKVPPRSMAPSSKSEYEELEAVPTMAVMDGPLEPSSTAVSGVADVPDDPVFINFFSVRNYSLHLLYYS
ncbi:unnamed protein product [Linum tenue]|uniref:mRNA-decapping enzyme-like protein n=1 Tax=Linum tenue TaxID=586396 RepID=A0AAV0ILT8_9ROSI|nr:unnamed protein product [Linum tenue]